MRIYFEVILLIIAVVVLFYIFFHYAGILLAPSSELKSGSVCIKENCFNVEVATTQVQREKGLIYRKELGKDNGMLFVFDKEGNYPFWMKNTLIPLDIIWADSNSKVVFIASNVQPCKSLICPSVNPGVGAKYVLEINAGLCEEIGLKLGDELKIDTTLVGT